MWFKFETRMPYHQDPDYRDSLVFGIKSKLGNVPVDITLFNDYGTLEVDVPSHEVAHRLYELPQVGLIYSSNDREMLVSPRTII